MNIKYYRFFCNFCKTGLDIREEEIDDCLSSSGACKVCGDKNWHVYDTDGQILI